MALSDRRKLLLKRLAALIKNLEKFPEHFTLDKQLDRTVDTLERLYSRHSQLTRAREAQMARKAVEDNKQVIDVVEEDSISTAENVVDGDE